MWEVFNLWLGGLEASLGSTFARARTALSHIILFDELDYLTENQEGSETDVVFGVYLRVLTTLLYKIGMITNVGGKYNVLVIVATNPLEMSDVALLC